MTAYQLEAFPGDHDSWMKLVGGASSVDTELELPRLEIFLTLAYWKRIVLKEAKGGHLSVLPDKILTIENTVDTKFWIDAIDPIRDASRPAG